MYETITLTKIWDDEDGVNKRPKLQNDATGANDPLDVRLYAEDTNISSEEGADIEPDSVVDNNDNTWIYTWNNVPKTDINGDAIQYVAHENSVPEGYTASGDVTITNGEADGALTNALSDGAVTTKDLTITKTWFDEGYEENRDDFTLEVLADSTSIVKTINVTVEGASITADGDIEIAGTNSDSWTLTVKDLPVSKDGQAITYTVRETAVPEGYSAEASDGVTLDGENPTLTVTNTYSPDEWTLTYNGNGGTTDVTDEMTYTSANNKATVKAAGEGTVFAGYVFLGWSTDQRAVIDSVEDEPSADMLYTEGEELIMTGNTTLYAVWAVDANGDGTPDYDQVENVTVNVVWNDDGNRCGIRPTEIGFKLKGEVYTIDLADTTDVRVNTNDGNTMWIYTVPTVFDKNNAPGKEDLTDVSVTAKAHADTTDTDGYTVEGTTWDADSNSYTITLSHTPETTAHHVTKTWDFSGASFAVGTATIQLLANGQPAEYTNGNAIETKTFESNGSEDLTWSNLPKYEGGQLITYHAVETQVMNGTDDVTAHFNVKYDWSTPDKTTMTNTYTELRDITLLYIWDDDNNASRERPTSVTVQLYNADTDEPIGDAHTISADENGAWSTTWTDLPIYPVTTQEEGIETQANGQIPINYEARVTSYVDGAGTHKVNLGEEDNELTESNYSFDVMSFGADSVFVMSSALDDVSFTATKTWVDDNNAYGTRPASVVVNLLQDNVVYQSAELTADDNWTTTWNALPAGHTYSVAEMPVDGYTPAYADGVITNTLDDLADRNEEYTVTFVYNHTSATDKDGNAITDPVTVKYDSSYQFTASADEGYILQTPSYEGSATLVSNGNNTFTLQNIRSDITVTINAEKKNSGDGGGIIIVPPDDDDDDDTDVKPPEDLNTEDHFSYIVGYAEDYRTGEATEDESLWPVKPQNDITRAEVATIFYRLLKDEVRDKYDTAFNGFSDVNTNDWFNVTVSTLADMGIVKGYEDGSFRPNAPITRAEFAAIATRFFEKTGATYEPGTFTDVTGNEWFAGAIQDAVNLGLIGGYEDGTVRPNNNITRAEACAIVNRTLGRVPDADHLLPDDVMKTWPDNPESAWFYADMQEATNGHEYEWITEDGNKVEEWTELLDNDWTDR